jgi:hypothetical protein
VTRTFDVVSFLAPIGAFFGKAGTAASEATVTVSRWGREGLKPGDWVMPGGTTWWNYVRSFKWDSISPTNIVAGPETGTSYQVLASSVKWPTGWGIDGWWKGLIFGQRIYKP